MKKCFAVLLLELLAPKGAIVNIEEGEINNYSGS